MTDADRFFWTQYAAYVKGITRAIKRARPARDANAHDEGAVTHGRRRDRCRGRLTGEGLPNSADTSSNPIP